jgi:hypothetical protein
LGEDIDLTTERTNFPSEVAEMALAHAAARKLSQLSQIVGNKVEAAYRRGNMFEKRRRLMQQWAGFSTTAPTQEQRSNVTLICGPDELSDRR